MAVETATYISDLNASNPTGTDLKSEGDNHIRLVKSTVKATFPNVTGAVTPTHTQFNYLAGATGTTGTTTTNIVFSTSPTITTPTFSGLITANGGQIKFPAVQSASADANTLDDYEEGSFTPTITFGGAAVGTTYSVQIARYTKVGNEVSFAISLALSAVGSSVGSVNLNGLPFAANSTVNFFQAVAVHAQALTGTSGGLMGYISPSGTAILIRYSGTGSASDLQSTNCTNTSFFMVTGTYFV